MEDRTKVFLKSALNQGILFGFILIIIQLAMWMLNFMPIGFGKGLLVFLASFLIYLYVIYWFTKNYRNKIMGGYINYGHAFLYGLTVFFISTVVLAVYSYIFNKLIDPDYTSRVIQATANWTEEFMRSKGVPESRITDAVDKITSRPIPSPLVASLTSILFGGLIMGSIVSLISSAFAKKVADPFQEGK
jgi:hypothetical protein